MLHIHVQSCQVLLRMGRGAVHLERDPSLGSAHLDRLALHPVRHHSSSIGWPLKLRVNLAVRHDLASSEGAHPPLAGLLG